MANCSTEAEIPLNQIDGDPEVNTSGKGEFKGIFFDKVKLIAAAVVLVILLIIIIVLAAVLGQERARRGKDEIHPGGETEEEKEGGSPTPPGPTTAGPEPWWRIRLPDNVIPFHYDLTLHIDMNKPNFKGKVKIWFNVTSPTPYVLVHALDMNFTANEVRKLSGGPIPIKRYFKFEKNQFLVTELETSLDRDQYTMTLEYSGEYGKDLRGMYKSSFIDENGKESFFTATQFEPLRARRAFPCFDEPAMKATFNVTLVHDPNLIALSNMPIYRSQIDDGWKYDHFRKTVKMSTYLAAFAVGDFKYKETKTGSGIQIRVYARPDVLDQVDYALKVSNETFIYFEEFFGVPYSLPKSDGIALPVFGPSGMENWGLIKYRETNLLLMEGETSSSSKESIAKLVAHEVGHQWFGNIVTMEWWTDLWLNEGFATYVSSIGMDHVHPEWNIIDQFIVIAVQDTLQLDGLASSHPVRIPVEDPQKIGEIFDAISYKKGASILLMLHYYLGNEVFRDGLKRYLTKHAYANAETDDLWNAMTEANKAAGKTMDVGKIMNTFTLQMGYPVVTITATETPNTYQATQDRFLYYKDPKANYSSSQYNYKWVIPFTYYTGSRKSNNPPTDTMSKIIDKETVSLNWDGNGWIKGNIGQTGFYRVNYEEKNWDMLAEQLKNNYKVFNATDRAGLIDDSFNLARANLLNHTKPLSISSYLDKEEDYVPMLSALRKFSHILEIVPSTRPAHKYLQMYVEYLTKTQYDKLGIKDQGTHLDKFLRTILLDANCEAGVRSCLGNMTKMFQEWMNDPVKNAVPADLKALVYHFGIVTGGEKEWNFAYDQFKTTTVISDKNTLLYAMAGSQQPWIIQRYLEYTLDPSKISPRNLVYVMYYIAKSNEMGANVAWNFFQLKWNVISKMYGGSYMTLRRFIPFVSRRFSTDFELQQLLDFIQTVNKGGPLSWTVQQSIEKVKENIQWRKTNENDVESWLKDFFAQKSKKDTDDGFTDPAK